MYAAFTLDLKAALVSEISPKIKMERHNLRSRANKNQVEKDESSIDDFNPCANPEPSCSGLNVKPDEPQKIVRTTIHSFSLNDSDSESSDDINNND